MFPVHGIKIPPEAFGYLRFQVETGISNTHKRNADTGPDNRIGTRIKFCKSAGILYVTGVELICARNDLIVLPNPEFPDGLVESAGARANSAALLSDFPIVQITRVCANTETVTNT